MIRWSIVNGESDQRRAGSRIARCFRVLEGYQLTRNAPKEVFELRRRFLRDERYSHTDQLRKASRAVGAMLAEAWARRRYKAVLVSKVDEALGEATEVQTWLDTALDLGNPTEAEYRRFDAKYRSIGGLLARMADRAEGFCKLPANAPTHFRSARQHA